eukprot:6181376-Pleurochrysis_carterae.AAC.1
MKAEIVLPHQSIWAMTKATNAARVDDPLDTWCHKRADLSTVEKIEAVVDLAAPIHVIALLDHHLSRPAQQLKPGGQRPRSIEPTSRQEIHRRSSKEGSAGKMMFRR